MQPRSHWLLQTHEGEFAHQFTRSQYRNLDIHAPSIDADGKQATNNEKQNAQSRPRRALRLLRSALLALDFEDARDPRERAWRKHSPGRTG